MAKTIKAPAKTPAREVNTTDFTFKEVNDAVIRFNRATVLKISFNSTTNTLTATLENDIEGTELTGSVVLGG